MYRLFIMANLMYHSIEPENNNSAGGYGEFSTADFVLTGDGRKYKANSLRLEGSVSVENATGQKVFGGAVSTELDWRLDNMIGFHGLIETITTEVQSQGNVEHLASYPRYCKMVASSSLDENDFNRSDLLAEGRSPVRAGGQYAIEPVGVLNTDSGGAAAVRGLSTDPSFSVKVFNCLNRMVGDDYSFDKHGYLKVSINFARAAHFISGIDCAGMKYTVKNLRLSFQTVPDDAKPGMGIIMQSYVSTKSTIQSQSSSIQSRVPSDAVNGVSVSFLRQDRESSETHNTYALEKLPNIENVKYMFSDTQNRFVSYTIDEVGDMLDRGIRSLAYAGHSQATQMTLKGNDGFIIGVPFASTMSLRNQKFTMSVDTSGSNLSASPYLVWMYFNTVISL